jgi:hypothetical protein
MPKSTLAITQSHLPAHRGPSVGCATAIGGLWGRERREEPAEVHLCTRRAARVGRLPGAPAEAHPLECPPKRAPC